MTLPILPSNLAETRRVVVLNFGHPLHPTAIEQIQDHAFCRDAAVEIIPVPVQISFEETLAPQIEEILRQIPLDPQAWSTASILVLMPGMSSAGALILAGIHGRSGSWPELVVLTRNDRGKFVLGEIISLTSVRADARMRRYAP